MKKHIAIGGLVAAGFDTSAAYMLVVSHAGRGVFSTATWDRVARDHTVVYPDDGHVIGIGPLDGVRIPVKELNYDTGELRFANSSCAL